MTRNRSLLLLGMLGVAQLAVCGSLIWRWESVLHRGASFRFVSQPVDPFDAFRGRFVAIRVEQDHLVSDGKPYAPGQAVYARLATNAAGFAHFDQLFLERPAEGVPYLKTTVSRVDDSSQFLPEEIIDASALARRILSSNDTVSLLLREKLQQDERAQLEQAVAADDPAAASRLSRLLTPFLNRMLYNQDFADRFLGTGKIANVYSEHRRMRRELVAAYPAELALPPGARVILNLPFDRFYMEESQAPRAESAYREHSRTQSAERTTITVRILNGQGLIENLWIGDVSIDAYLQANAGAALPR